jgi:hypothetical protein
MAEILLKLDVTTGLCEYLIFRFYRTKKIKVVIDARIVRTYTMKEQENRKPTN